MLYLVLFNSNEFNIIIIEKPEIVFFNKDNDEICNF